jgi:hypothetical protein
MPLQKCCNTIRTPDTVYARQAKPTDLGRRIRAGTREVETPFRGELELLAIRLLVLLFLAALLL